MYRLQVCVQATSGSTTTQSLLLQDILVPQYLSTTIYVFSAPKYICHALRESPLLQEIVVAQYHYICVLGTTIHTYVTCCASRVS